MKQNKFILNLGRNKEDTEDNTIIYDAKKKRMDIKFNDLKDYDVIDHYNIEDIKEFLVKNKNEIRIWNIDFNFKETSDTLRIHVMNNYDTRCHNNKEGINITYNSIVKEYYEVRYKKDLNMKQNIKELFEFIYKTYNGGN